MSLTYSEGVMPEPEVVVQCFHLGGLDHTTEPMVVSDALKHMDSWVESEVESYGVGQAIIIGDLSKCPNRVDTTHQPVPSSLVGTTLIYNCSDCTYSGTRTVGNDPTVLTWVNT